MQYLVMYILFSCTVRYEGELPKDCTDRADNDKDGLFDCDDLGCSRSPDCTSDPKNKIPNVLTIDWNALDHKNRRVFFHGVLFTGKTIELYTDGQIWNERTYIDGRQEGAEKGWNQDGSLLFERHFVAGKEEGMFQEWYENGQLAAQGDFEGGREHGKHLAWNKQGLLKGEWTYEQGELIHEKMWSEEGEVMYDRKCPCPHPLEGGSTW